MPVEAFAVVVAAAAVGCSNDWTVAAAVTKLTRFAPLVDVVVVAVLLSPQFVAHWSVSFLHQSHDDFDGTAAVAALVALLFE